MSKTILITGVSSGFGKYTSEFLASKGYNVYGTFRSNRPELKGVNLLNMDVTQPDAIKQTVDTILQKEQTIDVLINNAGMGIAGPIEETNHEEAALQMNTNFMGSVNMIQAILPVMRKAGGGTIVNLSSIGGLMGLPFQAFYAASKFAIEGLSEGLRMELKGHNIKIVVLEPGDFKTNFTANRKLIATANVDHSPYNDSFNRAIAVIEKDEQGGMKPEYFARKVYKILQKKNPRQRYVISSFEQKLAVFLKIILPGKIFRAILEGHYKV